MKRIAYLAAISFASAAVSSNAQAAKCNVVGTWVDSFNAQATFTTNKKGTADVSALCSTPYKLKVTGLSKKIFDVSGAAKDKSCPTFTASLTFQGGCTTASGTIDISGLGQYDDTWTKTGSLRHIPAQPSALTEGLKK